MIGAPTYDETEASNPACDPGQCHEAGRSYVYRGEDVMDPANGGAATPLQTPLRTLKSVTAQTDDPTSSARTDSELFGQAIFPIGDVGSCNAATPAGDPCPNASSTATPDGSPEVVVSAFRTDLPSNADFPDPAFFDVGVNMLVDGKTGAVLAIYQHPEPQAGSIFGFTLHNEPAAGDLGSTPLADVFIPAMRQNVDFTAQGRGYVMNGNFKAGANGTNFAQVNDPTPSRAATSASRRPVSATSSRTRRARRATSFWSVPSVRTTRGRTPTSSTTSRSSTRSPNGLCRPSQTPTSSPEARSARLWRRWVTSTATASSTTRWAPTCGTPTRRPAGARAGSTSCAATTRRRPRHRPPATGPAHPVRPVHRASRLPERRLPVGRSNWRPIAPSSRAAPACA